MKSLYVLLLSTLILVQQAMAYKTPSRTTVVTTPEASAKAASILGSGLQADYYNGINFETKVYSRIDAEVNFDWEGKSPAPGVHAEYFSVRWTGKLFIPVSGKYKIKARVDDGIRLWVGGIQLFDEWRQQEPSTYSQEIELQAGQYYDLKIEYYNDWKGAVIQLLWEPPKNETNVNDFFTEPSVSLIPQNYLFSTNELPFQKVVSTPTQKPTPDLQPEAKPTKKRTEPKVVATPVVVSVAQPKPNQPKEETFEDLKAGEAVVLKNVYFKQSKYVLLEESFPELDKLANTLKKYSHFQMEISGHTDNQGDPRLNLALSENRAKVVATYLVNKGIDPARITTKGYGSDRPVADNAIESQRTQNRRVEFVLK